MASSSLEGALLYAGMSGDINSLKCLARDEEYKFAVVHNLLCMVLEKTGPVAFNEIPDPDRGHSVSFSLTKVDGGWVIRAGDGTEPIPSLFTGT